MLEIDVQGASQVRARDASALLIFLTAPSEQVQQQRLRSRGDTSEQIGQRLVHTAREVEEGERPWRGVRGDGSTPRSHRDERLLGIVGAAPASGCGWGIRFGLMEPFVASPASTWSPVERSPLIDDERSIQVDEEAT